MQEGEVSVGRETYQLKPPFFVVATQNPIEMEGTYPLPEAQLDRFMFNVKVKYPTVDEEVQIIKGTTSTLDAAGRQGAGGRGGAAACKTWSAACRLPTALSATLPGSWPPAARREQKGARSLEVVHKYLSYGASPRASQYLVLGAKARAILAGKYHVDFADIQALAAPVLRHRLVLNFHARADNLDADVLVERLLELVPVEEER